MQLRGTVCELPCPIIDRWHRQLDNDHLGAYSLQRMVPRPFKGLLCIGVLAILCLVRLVTAAGSVQGAHELVSRPSPLLQLAETFYVAQVEAKAFENPSRWAHAVPAMLLLTLKAFLVVARYCGCRAQLRRSALDSLL